MTPRNLIEPARLAGGAVLRSQSDDRLIDLVRAGNDRAFEAIVHRYRRPLLRYCGRFLSGARAEDAVQQTFMNAYGAMKADERRIDLRPWLFRIAHNASLNVLRSSAGAIEEPISDEIDGVERPDQAVERRQSLAEVVAAVQALPPRQRDAIVLHELEGRSYDQIATEMKVSGGAVRQLLSRARTTLRAGATAIVPEWALARIASAGGDPVATRVAELVAAGGGAALVTKVGTAVVVAGAVAVGAAEGPLDVTGHGGGQGAQREAAALGAGAQGSSEGVGGPAAGGPAGYRTENIRDRTRGRSGSRGERRNRGRGRRGDDSRSRRSLDDRGHGGRSEPGGGGEHGDEDRHSGDGDRDADDRSGSGGSGSDDHRSGSGSGNSDDDSSGPGSGELVTDEPDHSGSDSDDSAEDSGSSGSGDSVASTPTPDDSSGPGSGSDDGR